MKPMTFAAWVVLLVFVGGGSYAQESDVQAPAAGIQQNMKALHDYAWQSRVSLEVDDAQKKVGLYQVRYNYEGKLERTQMGGEAAKQKKVRGPLRKHKAKKKKKEIGEFTHELTALLQSYMSPDSFKKSLSRAFARKEGGMLTLQSTDVVQDGDKVSFEVVEATKQPMTMKVESETGGSPVVLEITFQKLADGPNHPARQVVTTQFEGKKIVMVTENFSYVKQGRGEN